MRSRCTGTGHHTALDYGRLQLASFMHCLRVNTMHNATIGIGSVTKLIQKQNAFSRIAEVHAIGQPEYTGLD